MTRLAVLAFVVTTGFALVEDGATVTGPVQQVHRGDLFTVDGTLVRLWGIMAPDFYQRCLDETANAFQCGRIARDALETLTSRTPVSCTEVERAWKRVVARCTVNGADIAAIMVAAGYAVENPAESGGAYAAAETIARNDRRGIWAGWIDPHWLPPRN